MLNDLKKLGGKKIILERFDEHCFTPEYFSWLNDPEVFRFSRHRFINHTDQTCLDYLNSFKGTDNLFLTIKSQESSRFIGTMTAYISKYNGTADIGLMIGDRTVWGIGFGLDAWQTLMNYLFIDIGIRKITAGTLNCNIGMIKIMERSGMELEAIRQKQQLIENAFQDEFLYAKFRA